MTNLNADWDSVQLDNKRLKAFGARSSELNIEARDVQVELKYFV